MDKKVSVIIPCYNQGKFLEDAVNSVLGQTYNNIEIVVINDGSTDEFTNDFLATYSPDKTKIITIDNQGVSNARNVGIQSTDGDYILPLDADDKIAPTYIEKAVKILEDNPKVGIVKCESAFFGAKRGKWIQPEYKFPHILLTNTIVNTSMFRRSDYLKTTGYNVNMVHGLEDYDFWLSLIELGVEVYEIKEVLFFYRQLDISRNKEMINKYQTKSLYQLLSNHKDLYIKNLDFIIEHLKNPYENEQNKYINFKTNLGKKLKLEICLKERN